MDGSTIGRGGYFNHQCDLSETGFALLPDWKQIAPLISTEAQVVFLGAGEFDGSQRQETINTTYHWKYVCRMAKNIQLKGSQCIFCPGEIALQAGECVSFLGLLFSRQAYGPQYRSMSGS